MDIETLNNVLQIFTKVLVIFLILPVHEYAHAWAAHKMGDDTAAYMGRLTLNPLSHIDIFGALCLLLTGFGWAKPVPINPIKFKKQRLGISLTAAAGPLSNLIVAFLVTVIYRIVISLSFVRESIITSTSAVSGAEMFLYILQCFITINIGLALFNLIPIPPLDGSKIVSYFTSASFDRWINQHQMIISIVFMAVVLSRVLSGPLNWAAGHILDFFWLITNFIPKLMGA